MDNSAFRNLVKEGGATPAPKSAANSEEAKAAKAAKAAARKAAYDKRMELQAKRQEKLGEGTRSPNLCSSFEARGAPLASMRQGCWRGRAEACL